MTKLIISLVLLALPGFSQQINYDTQLKNQPKATDGTSGGKIGYKSDKTGSVLTSADKVFNTIINVKKDFGCVGDGVTSDQPCFTAWQAYVAAHPGTRVNIPCTKGENYLISLPIVIPSSTGVFGDTFRGCQITYMPIVKNNWMIDMIGADSSIISSLRVSSASQTYAPKYLMRQSRTVANIAAGHHNFRDLNIQGYADYGGLYNIGSEENSYVNFLVEHVDTSTGTYTGNAVNGVHISGSDDQNLCAGSCPTASCLSNWFIHSKVSIYNATGSNVAAIYLHGSAGAGNFIFRDGYISLPLSDTAGAGVAFLPGDAADNNSGYSYYIANNRQEGGGYGVHFVKNLNGVSSNRVTGFHYAFNDVAGANTYGFYSDDNVAFYQGAFDNNHIYVNAKPSSFFTFENSFIKTSDDGNLTIRNTVANSEIDFMSSQGATVTLPSPGNVFNTRVSTLDTDKFYRNVNITPNFSGKSNLTLTPLGSAETSAVTGDLSVAPFTDPYRGGAYNTLWLGENTNTINRVLTSNRNYLNELRTQSGGVFHDATGRLFNDTGKIPVASACGTSPTLNGGDQWFRVGVGTGGVTSCTITFATAFPNTPIILVSNGSFSNPVWVSGYGTSSFTFSSNVAMSGQYINVFVGGW